MKKAVAASPTCDGSHTKEKNPTIRKASSHQILDELHGERDCLVVRIQKLQAVDSCHRSRSSLMIRAAARGIREISDHCQHYTWEKRADLPGAPVVHAPRMQAGKQRDERNFHKHSI